MRVCETPAESSLTWTLAFAESAHTTRQVSFSEPDAALAARIEGIVEMKGVVLSDGMVGDITVTKSLDAGLDQEAIAAWKRSTFTPGMKDGQPVAVRVDFQTRFTLRGD